MNAEAGALSEKIKTLAMKFFPYTLKTLIVHHSIHPYIIFF
jgi:hypothetical protein